MIDNGVVGLTGTAAVIYTGRGIGDAPVGQKRPAVIVKNLHASENVWVGGADVTADTTAETGGYLIAAGKELALGEMDSTDVLYGVTDGSSVNVCVLEKF